MNGTAPFVAGLGNDAPDTGHKQAITRQFEARRNAMSVEAAEAALNRGDYLECEQTLRSVLDRDATHRDARLLLAEVMMLTGRRPEAFAQLEHALREHREDPQVHYAMALLLDASGRPGEARDYYARSVELNPQFAVYTSLHEEMQEEASGEESSAPGEAVAYHSAARGASSFAATSEPRSVLSPPDSSARWAEPVAAAPGSTTRTTAFPANRAIHFSPAVNGPLQKAKEALMRGDADAAIAQFRTAMTAAPEDPHIPIYAATLALELNHPAAAVAVLSSAAQRFPNLAAIHLATGVAHYRLGDYSASQVALRQALSLDNTSGLAYLLMGCTLEKLGQLEAARIQWDRAAALNPRYRNLRL